MLRQTTSAAVFAKLAVATGAILILMSGVNAAAWQALQSGLPGREEDFVKDVAQSTQVEIEASKLAMTKAAHPEVKAFAEKLVKEHEAASTELMVLVKTKNATWPPDDPGMKAKKQKHESLTTLSGVAFDKEYLEDMISDHEETMALFGKQSHLGKDPAIKAFADKTLPALRDRLKMARDLRAKIAG